MELVCAHTQLCMCACVHHSLVLMRAVLSCSKPGKQIILSLSVHHYICVCVLGGGGGGGGGGGLYCNRLH